MTCPKCRGSGGLGPCPDCGAEPMTAPLAAWLQCTDLEIVRSLIDDWKADVAKRAENHRLACQELSSVVGALQSVRAERDAHLADLKLVEANRDEVWEELQIARAQVENRDAGLDHLKAVLLDLWETVGDTKPWQVWFANRGIDPEKLKP